MCEDDSHSTRQICHSYDTAVDTLYVIFSAFYVYVSKSGLNLLKSYQILRVGYSNRTNRCCNINMRINRRKHVIIKILSMVETIFSIVIFNIVRDDTRRKREIVETGWHQRLRDTRIRREKTTAWMAREKKRRSSRRKRWETERQRVEGENARLHRQ